MANTDDDVTTNNNTNDDNNATTRNTANNRILIQERREKIWALLTRGNMKGYEIAKELNVSPPTVARDIKFLIAESQNYLNNLAKETLPFMYQISIEGIRDIIRECWAIYQSENTRGVNMYQRISALKLAKECNEAIFKLLEEDPSVMYLKQLQEKLAQVEAMKQQQGIGVST
jgi:transcriptional antiterminator